MVMDFGFRGVRCQVGGCLTVFGNFVHLRCRPLIVAIGTAGETACPTLLDQSFGELGGAGGFACRRKPNPQNGYAPLELRATKERDTLFRMRLFTIVLAVAGLAVVAGESAT